MLATGSHQNTSIKIKREETIEQFLCREEERRDGESEPEERRRQRGRDRRTNLAERGTDEAREDLR